MSKIKLKSVRTAPHDGTYILLFGPSGYMGTPLRCQVCRYDAEYRPLQPWVTHGNQSFEDGGDPATYWAELPDLPMITQQPYKPKVYCVYCGNAIEAGKLELAHGNYACPICVEALSDDIEVVPEVVSPRPSTAVVRCVCCSRQIVSKPGYSNEFVTCGPVTHMGMDTFACASCSADLDENGMFPEER